MVSVIGAALRLRLRAPPQAAEHEHGCFFARTFSFAGLRVDVDERSERAALVVTVDGFRLAAMKGLCGLAVWR